MPRFSSFQLNNIRILKNTPPITDVNPPNFQTLRIYSQIANDLKLTWDGDIQFDTETNDLAIAYNLEAYIQNLYHRIITQVGRLPADGNYGWNFEYLYQISVIEQRQVLRDIITDISNTILQDPDTLTLENIAAQIINTGEGQHNIEINIEIRPKKSPETILGFDIRTNS